MNYRYAIAALSEQFQVFGFPADVKTIFNFFLGNDLHDLVNIRIE